MNLTICLVRDGKSEIVEYVATSATTVRAVLDHVLDQCGCAKDAANWMVVFDGRILRHEDLLSIALGQCGEGQDISLLISAAEEPCQGPPRQETSISVDETDEFPYRLQAEKDRTSYSLPWKDERLYAPPREPIDDLMFNAEEGEDLDFSSCPSADWKSGGDHRSEADAPPPGGPPRSHPAESPPRASRRRYSPPKRSARQLVSRHSTVRYYSKMNPSKMFPLLVVISEKIIADAVRKGVEQERSGPFKVKLGSEVVVEPILPGCYCYPPEMSLRITPGEVDARFCVVPHVLGRLPEPRVVLRSEGEVIAVIPLDIRVSRQTLAIATSIAGFLLPFGMAILKHLHLDFESQLKDKFSLYASLLRLSIDSLSAEFLAFALLLTSLIFYIRCRPRRRDIFWDIVPVSPEEQMDLAIEALLRGDEARWSKLTDSLLGVHPEFLPAWRNLGRWHYENGRFDDALYHFEHCVEIGSVQPEDHFDAALAAARIDDFERASFLLKDAERRLPRGSITPLMWYTLGCHAARSAKPDEGIKYLERAVDLGFRDGDQIRENPDLSPLRPRSDFTALLARLRTLPIDSEMGEILHLKSREATAEGYATTQGFVVRANSRARIANVPSIYPHLKELKESLLRRGILAERDGHLVVTQEHVFDSPSSAAGVMLGRSANGRTEWKDRAGRTLKEIQEDPGNGREFPNESSGIP